MPRSSKKLAAIASDIMEMAKHGGPVQHYKDQLRERFPEESTNLEFLDRIDSVFRPYIDNAESLAASVLTQAKKS